MRRISDGRPLKNSVNPVEVIDLENLKTWQDTSNSEKPGLKGYLLPCQSITDSNLPDGHKFDQYGLIAVAEVINPIVQRDIAQAETSTGLANDKTGLTTCITSSPDAVADASSPLSTNQLLGSQSPNSPLSSLGTTPAVSPTGTPRSCDYVALTLPCTSAAPQSDRASDQLPRLTRLRSVRASSYPASASQKAEVKRAIEATAKNPSRSRLREWSQLQLF